MTSVGGADGPQLKTRAPRGGKNAVGLQPDEGTHIPNHQIKVSSIPAPALAAPVDAPPSPPPLPTPENLIRYEQLVSAYLWRYAADRSDLLADVHDQQAPVDQQKHAQVNQNSKDLLFHQKLDLLASS
ncbi:hypothetical protein V2J09_000309 [Rumex salicifolius]